MSNEPLDLSHWISRVRDEIPDLRLVGGSIEFGAVEGRPRTTPACFVMQGRENAGGDAGSSEHLRQRVDTTVEIFLAIRNVSDARGEAAADAIRPFRVQLWTALLGWKAPGADLPTAFAGGNPFAFREQTLWWVDRFRTTYWVMTP